MTFLRGLGRTAALPLGAILIASAAFGASLFSAPRPAAADAATRGKRPVPVANPNDPDRPESSAARPEATMEKRVRFPTYRVPGGGIRVPPELAEVAFQPDEDGEGEVAGAWPASPEALARIARGTIGANVRLNDTTDDPPHTCNSETHLAAAGDQVVAGWNDGRIFPDPPGAAGYAYSIDGGATWTDGGLLPAPPDAVYHGDPVLATDGQGNFYYASLYSPDGDRSTVSVNRGRFLGDSLVWDPPVEVFISSLSDFYDKEWMACDPVDGTLYLACTLFTGGGGSSIVFSRSTDHGATWSSRRSLTSSNVEGVQGSRLVVGPDRELILMYFAYDYSRKLSFIRLRRSTDQGATFGLKITLPAGEDGVITNYGSGPPGFNRGRGIGLPSLAVDRSSGPRRGRLYAVWEETVDYLPDPLGTLGPLLEQEPNGAADSARTLVVGQTVLGRLEAPTDQDWFRFEGEAGRTAIFYLAPDSTDPGYAEIRLFCEGGGASDRVMFSDLGVGYGLIVYTLPRTGVYYASVRVSNLTGRYALATGWHRPRASDLARDTRDVIVQSSADGIAWDAPRVVSTAPRADEAFPEVAVDGGGALWIDWYGHRADSCAIRSEVFFTRSTDGGAHFEPEARASDGPPINWNLVATNLAPNMGDYMALVADRCRVYANFSDGRDGTPDAWLAVLDECSTPVGIAWRGFTVLPGGVRVSWQSTRGDLEAARVERRALDGPWREIGNVLATPNGTLAFVDPTARAGGRYGYRLLDRSGVEIVGSEAWIEVPARAALALNVSSVGARGTLELDVTWADASPARLEVFDAGGRRVRVERNDAPEPKRAHHSLAGFTPGIYWVMITQAGASKSARAVILR